MKIKAIKDIDLINDYIIRHNGVSDTNIYFESTVEEIKNVLGEPYYRATSEVEKTQYEWAVQDENGRMFFIHDHKYAEFHNFQPLTEKIQTYWHICTNDALYSNDALHTKEGCTADAAAIPIRDYIVKAIAEIKFEGTEFLLGKEIFYLNGFEIIEHSKESPFGEGACCFNINDECITDGDGHPADFDNTYVEIDLDDYLRVMQMFRDCGNRMDKVADDSSKPIDRELEVGDYIYFGGGFYAKVISRSSGLYWLKEFYYDYYSLNISLDHNPIESFKDEYDIDDIKEEGYFISEETYDKALEVAEKGVKDIMTYLKELYKSKKHNNG